MLQFYHVAKLKKKKKSQINFALPPFIYLFIYVLLLCTNANIVL